MNIFFIGAMCDGELYIPPHNEKFTTYYKVFKSKQAMQEKLKKELIKNIPILFRDSIGVIVHVLKDSFAFRIDKKYLYVDFKYSISEAEQWYKKPGEYARTQKYLYHRFTLED